MTAAEVWRRVRPNTPDLAAPVLLLVGPFWSFLHYHNYSFLPPESLFVGGALGAAGLLCGLWLIRTRYALLRTLIVTVLLVVAIDFQVPQADGYFRMMVVVLFAAAWFLRTHITTLVTVTALAFYTSNLAIGTQLSVRDESVARATSEGRLPPLFHFILDEHIGLDGIPLDVPGAVEAKADLIETYVGQGFRLFARAYSPYHYTLNAIPNLMNFARSDVNQGWLGGAPAKLPAALSQNAFFEELREAGYALRIYQPTFIDLCAGEAQPESCYSIPNNAMLLLHHLELPWYPRMWFVLTYYAANNSYVYGRVRGVYQSTIRPLASSWGFHLPEWYWVNSRLGVAGAMDLLARMRSDLGDVESIRGTAFIAHLLHPHAPYLLDRHCRAHPSVRQRLEPLAEMAENSSETRRGSWYQSYLPQAQCLALQLQELFQEVERVGGQDAIIILQGDHGSRIAGLPSGLDAASMTVANFGDLFSSFFAVKAPGIAPGIDTTVVATHDLLRFLTTTGFTDTDVPPDSTPIVFLQPEANGPLVPASLPPFWPTVSTGSR